MDCAIYTYLSFKVTFKHLSEEKIEIYKLEKAVFKIRIFSTLWRHRKKN